MKYVDITLLNFLNKKCGVNMNQRNFVKLLDDIKLLNSKNSDIEQEAKRDLRIELQAQNELLENGGCVFAKLPTGVCKFDRASLLE